MSRTNRRHAESFEEYYKYWLVYRPSYKSDIWIAEFLKRERYKYKTQTRKYYDYGLPKFYRNMVNRSRRRKDSRELYKELTFNDYVGAYDLWNCTSSNSWGYW